MLDFTENVQQGRQRCSSEPTPTGQSCRKVAGQICVGEPAAGTASANRRLPGPVRAVSAARLATAGSGEEWRAAAENGNLLIMILSAGQAGHTFGRRNHEGAVCCKTGRRRSMLLFLRLPGDRSCSCSTGRAPAHRGDSVCVCRCVYVRVVDSGSAGAACTPRESGRLEPDQMPQAGRRRQGCASAPAHLHVRKPAPGNARPCPCMPPWRLMGPEGPARVSEALTRSSRPAPEPSETRSR